MSRYIDADKLKYSLELSVKSWGRDCNSKAPVIKTTYQDVLNRLEAMPAADVAPVRSGEWVYHECVSTHDGCKSGYSCSVCDAFVKEEVFDTDEFHKAFCGNCGAKIKMEGGYPLVCIAEDTMPVPGNCPALEAMAKRVIGSERIVEPNKEELLELMEELKYERRT
ncbi:MAG: hypothetical protein IKJ13_07690 [Clostridia bacterium]|nr:hypothetical protein [Clostridia bacterium]